MRQAYQGILAILAKFIDAVDSYTQEHSLRVSNLAGEIAETMGLPGDEVESIRVAGLLHDVGKIDVSLEVLKKASALDEDEWAQIKTHAIKGTAMLQPVGGLLRDVVPLVEFHHECYDGSGYLGLAGEVIPLGARILSVADSYDAMVCDRPYRAGRTSVRGHQGSRALQRNAVRPHRRRSVQASDVHQWRRALRRESVSLPTPA